MEIVERVRSGNVRAVARLMTDFEANMPYALRALRNLYPYTGKAHIVGITGAPGVGKSTLIDSITRILRNKGMTIGIIAIDPTSPFTGGALLGDRIRMEKHNIDAGVFIRSLGTRGGTGGLSRAALGMTYVLDAMGKDIIIIETVGIGQSEIDITRITDTSALVLVPGMGDTIQLMKAGILEAADIFIINKASKDGAEILMMELESMMSPGRHRPTLLTEALLEQGTEEVVDTILKHKLELISRDELRERRRERVMYELMTVVDAAVRRNIEAVMKQEMESLAEDIVDRKTDPYSAAEHILTTLVKHIKE
jgi:LAO/AO transport system kinase